MTFNLCGIFVLIAAFLASFNKIIMKKWNSDDHILTVILYPNLLLCLLMLPFIFQKWQLISLYDIGLFFLMGIMAFINQYVYFSAYKFGNASSLAPVTYTSFAWATLLEFIVFGNVPDIYVVSGASMIILSNLYLIHKEISHKNSSKASECMP